MKTKIILLLLIIYTALVPAVQQAEAKSNPQVLLLYDSLAKGTIYEDNVETMQRLLSALGTEVMLQSFDSYPSGLVESYQNVIVMKNVKEASTLDEEVTDDLLHYKGRYMHIGANPPDSLVHSLSLKLKSSESDTIELKHEQFSQASVNTEQIHYIESYAPEAATYGDMTSRIDGNHSPYGVMLEDRAYVSFFQGGNSSELLAGYMLRDWLKIEGHGKPYVLLAGVYPFSDLEHIRRAADQLYDAGIPFLVSSGPLFSNFEYPSAQRYSETLKYVQSKNGSVLVNAPAIAYTISADTTVLQDNMTLYIDWLAKNEIVPLGITAELYWFYDEFYGKEGIHFFDSAVLLPNERVMSYIPSNKATPLSSSLFSIDAASWHKYNNEDQAIEFTPVDVAITLNVADDTIAFDAQLEQLLKEWIVISDYKYEAHTVQTEAHTIQSQHGILNINGVTIEKNSSFHDINSDFAYVVEEEASLERYFSIQNNIFLVIIGGVLIIFSIILLMGYRLYKDKYINRGL